MSIGQPRSSKSTRTCAAIGVDVSSVETYSGLAYTTRTNSSTSAKFRSAWMPPAVAQAPIVTSAFDAARTALYPLGVLGGRDRALDEREVVRPFDDAARRLEEVGDLDLAGEREQLVLAVEERELATVAGRELPHRELRPAAHSSRTASHGAATAYG